jgi:hypothetical protein
MKKPQRRLAVGRSGMEAIQVVMVLAVATITLLFILHFLPTIRQLLPKMRQQVFGKTNAANTTTSELSNPNPLPPSATSTRNTDEIDTSSNAAAIKQPSLIENALVLGTLFAVVGWSAKEMIVFVRLRAELAVLEVLSDYQERTYSEIISAVINNKIHRRIRFIRGSITDALAALVAKDKVTIRNWKYSLAAIQQETADRKSEEVHDSTTQVPAVKVVNRSRKSSR